MPNTPICGLRWSRAATRRPCRRWPPHCASTGTRPGSALTTPTTSSRSRLRGGALARTLANYNDLAPQGATRVGMQLSPAALNTAVLRLQDAEQSGVGLVAQSILQVIMVLAEGLRWRGQAARTARAWGRGEGYTITASDAEHHINWALLSRAALALGVGVGLALSPSIEVGGIVYATSAALQAALMTAYHSNMSGAEGRGLLASDFTTYCVTSEGLGDYPTIQAAVDAAPSDGVHRTIYLAKGTYEEAVVVPASKSDLFILVSRTVSPTTSSSPPTGLTA
ncbi:ribosome-inactivating family protein [Streptomyces sp. NPDC047081]|uniref:ribosome-inactivating family protein n=1 Tax=Streptomyces sp. NPDC047081 TaxID=3154706 RepID=UPI0033E8130B